MPNTTKILEALSTYTGDTESLNRFAVVAESELGPQWTSTIYDALPNLPASLKEKLDHAFNYYGATASWNEIQEYLTQADSLNISEISERIPTLEYWLKFFGEPGLNAVKQLEEKINRQIETEQVNPVQTVEEQEWTSQEEILPEENNAMAEENADFYEAGIDETYQENIPAVTEEVYEQGIDETFHEMPETERGVQEPIEETDSYFPDSEYPVESMDDSLQNENFQPIESAETEVEYIPDENEFIEENSTFSQEDNLTYSPDNIVEEESDFNNPTEDIEESSWKNPVYVPQKADTNEQFMAKKTFRQLDFVNAVHAWINARCITLGNIEIYAYKYYGFLVDAMEQAKTDIQEVLSKPTYYPAVEEVRKDGLKILQNSLLSLEKDLKIAYDNAQTDITPLIAENMNTNILKDALGKIDTTNKKEYLGPAPDGFEMIDDPYAETESQVETLEEQRESKNMRAQVKSASQKKQNSVQRKISFSFNKKNPSGTV